MANKKTKPRHRPDRSSLKSPLSLSEPAPISPQHAPSSSARPPVLHSRRSAKGGIPRSPLLFLYSLVPSCLRGRSALEKPPLFAQNKPNSQNEEIAVTSCVPKTYNNIPLRPRQKNKPKQTQSRPAGKAARIEYPGSSILPILPRNRARNGMTSRTQHPAGHQSEKNLRSRNRKDWEKLLKKFRPCRNNCRHIDLPVLILNLIKTSVGRYVFVHKPLKSVA